MPLYEYHCAACGHRFELLQRLGEGADGVECPHCGARRTRREVSRFASVSSTGSAPAGGGCGPGGFT